MVRSGRVAPCLASAARRGAWGKSFAVRPTTSSTSVWRMRLRIDPGLLSAQDRVPLEELALIHLGRVLQIEPAALREETDGVLPEDELDVRLRDAGVPHGRCRLRDLERIAHAPIGRAVDDDPLGPVAPD